MSGISLPIDSMCQYSDAYCCSTVIYASVTQADQGLFYFSLGCFWILFFRCYSCMFFNDNYDFTSFEVSTSSIAHLLGPMLMIIFTGSIRRVTRDDCKNIIFKVNEMEL